MKLQIGRRDHHHVLYHMDHGEVFGRWDAPLSLEQIIENVLFWCRNTGVNAFNLQITGATRHFLDIAEFSSNAEPPFLHLGHWDIYETIRYHKERGVNVMDEIAKALHGEGIELWAGLRVNDIHHTTGGESAHPRFWAEHPEYRTNESVVWDYMRSVGALDFAHKEVRDYTKGLVEKIFELYDVDGICLDFNRMPILFKSNEVDQHRDKVTQWMHEVRAVVDQAAQKQGHPVHLEARVPSVAEQCYRMGADTLRWIDEEIVHVLSPSTIRYVEYEMPLEPFIEAAKGKDVLVFAGIEGLQADGILSREMYRAWAYHYWKMGVDGLHLFNNCYNFIYGAGAHPVEELHDPDWLAHLGKRYAVTRTSLGASWSEKSDPLLSYPKQLPRTLQLSDDGRGEIVTINVDDDLDQAKQADILESLGLMLRVTEKTLLDKIVVKVNGQIIPENIIRIRGSGWDRKQARLPNVYNEPPWTDDTSGSYRWVFCDLSQGDYLRTGSNEIEVILTEKNPAVLAPLQLYNVEVDIKYRHIQHEGNRDTGRF